MTETRPRGAPPKLALMGKTHRYSPVNVPSIVLHAFKRAVKETMNTMTMADYLRVRVMNDARKKLEGEPKTPEECNYGGIIIWSEIPWIKPDKKTGEIKMTRHTTPVLYPKKHWTIFAHNCSVKGMAPKHQITRYMIELIEEWRRIKKAEKKRRKK